MQALPVDLLDAIASHLPVFSLRAISHSHRIFACLNYKAHLRWRASVAKRAGTVYQSTAVFRRPEAYLAHPLLGRHFEALMYLAFLKLVREQAGEVYVHFDSQLVARCSTPLRLCPKIHRSDEALSAGPVGVMKCLATRSLLQVNSAFDAILGLLLPADGRIVAHGTKTLSEVRDSFALLHRLLDAGEAVTPDRKKLLLSLRATAAPPTSVLVSRDGCRCVHHTGSDGEARELLELCAGLAAAIRPPEGEGCAVVGVSGPNCGGCHALNRGEEGEGVRRGKKRDECEGCTSSPTASRPSGP